MATKKKSNSSKPSSLSVGDKVTWRYDDNKLSASELPTLTEQEEDILLKIRHSGVRQWAMDQLGMAPSERSTFQIFSQECWEEFQNMTHGIEEHDLATSIPSEVVITSVHKCMQSMHTKEDIQKVIAKLYMLYITIRDREA